MSCNSMKLSACRRNSSATMGGDDLTVLTTETRSYLLAGDLGGYALRLYYLEHER